jgi:glucose/arabinose dehydrogenase
MKKVSLVRASLKSAWGTAVFVITSGLLFGPCSHALAQASNVLQRVPNTTLQMPQTPQSFWFQLQNAFGNLVFNSPLALYTPSGETNRVFVLEQTGRIYVITNLAAPNKTLFLDLSRKVIVGNWLEGLRAMAFHPGYATNGFFFVGYNLDTQTAAGTGSHYRVSRLSVSPDNPNLALATNEMPFITQRYTTTFGACNNLLFGPDGYLYLAVTDPSLDSGDSLTTAQRIDLDLFSGILRIDVDRRPDSLAPNPHPAVTTNYAIPPDNPFIGATKFNGASVDPTKVRTEFYAVGLRNPWELAYDEATGLLYLGDPGPPLSTVDRLDVIAKGGNYGWPFRLGTSPGPLSSKTPAGFVGVNPIYQSTYWAIFIGAVVYQGPRFPQLEGALLVSDYNNGYLSALRYAGTNVPPVQRLATESGIISLSTDPGNGDLLAVNYDSGLIRRLTNSTRLVGTPLPPTLADTGAFASLAALTPNAGVVPYDLNLPSWSDNAQETRWFSIPSMPRTIGFSRDGNWSFPPGTVWVQHFDLELTNGVPASAFPLETRLLVSTPIGAYGVNYRWGGSLTNAALVPAQGLDEAFTIQDGGTVRTQVWHYPSQSECVTCHNPLAGYALAFNTAQLNRTRHYGGVAQNQIRALSDAGYFSQNLSEQYTLPALAPPTNGAISLDFRVHSYLAANCVQCHQPGGIGRGNFDTRLTTPLRTSGLINGIPIDTLGDRANLLITPGSTQHSVLFSRISNLGPDYMPPLGSTVLDPQALDLFATWITNGLAGYQSYADWQVAYFGSTNSPDAAPNATNLLAYLTGTNPLRPSDDWSIGIGIAGTQPQISFLDIANRGFQVQWTTNLPNPNSWQPLDVPGNAPLFSVTNSQGSVSDPSAAASSKFYRVQVIEP